MIYTVTFNPAIDYILHITGPLSPNTVNRSTAEEYYIGGKGINVSFVLKTLGIESTVLGFIAGFTGNAIQEGLRIQNINTDFILLENGISRINIKMKSESETELNAQGPVITESDFQKLLDKINQLKNGDILVLSGSVPRSLPNDIYERILAATRSREIKVIVDASCDLLMNTLKYHPFLIKPNLQELCELFNISNYEAGKLSKDKKALAAYANKLQNLGADNVLISLGSEGAVLLTTDGRLRITDAPQGIVKNSVGAGDSMIAGYLYGLIKYDNPNDAFKMGIAAGSATAFSEGLGSSELIHRIYIEL